ncbi:MAG: Arc family DNA-binding protein [Nevskiales bacterium]|nr:Arc family DNA-binding protein [Nevskiales bacterium]
MNATTSLGLRLPRALRDKLNASAGREGRSLNSEIIRRLEASLDQGQRFGAALASVELEQRVWRMRCGTTYDDLARVRLLLSTLPVEGLLLAAKANQLNNAVLVALIETPIVTVLIDRTSMNMARFPRMQEIGALMADLDIDGITPVTRYVNTLVPDTSGLPAEDAVSVLTRLVSMPLDSVADYLRVLAQHEHIDHALSWIERYSGESPHGATN